MRKILTTGVAFGCLLMAPQLAHADYSFSNVSADSGTLVSAGETWTYGGGSPPFQEFYWGSPGVDAGLATYGESDAATDFEITFPTVTLDESEIAPANTACDNTVTSETIFCSGSGSSAVQWIPTEVGSDGIEFTAPAGTMLTDGEDYFVNVVLVDAVGEPFSGSWSTVPEPASSGLLAAGLFGLGWVRRRRGKPA